MSKLAVFRRRHILLFLAILTLLVLLGGASLSRTALAEVLPQGPCSRDGDFRHTQHMGRACRLPNGDWRIKLRDGHLLDTHGPDPIPVGETIGEDPVIAAASPYVCVPTTTYHNLIIYAVPSDRTDRYDTMADVVRGYFQGAQDKLNTEAMVFGETAAYKMACDLDGRVTVRREVLPTAAGSSNFSTITSDLRARGYTSTFAHYWVYWDASLSGVCGQGDFRNDTRPVVNNSNNTGPRYALNYGCNAMMHENGHNMGAVQNDSPNTSGAAHCNDDRDVMCYNDGGPNSGGYRRDVCTDREYFDCNHNDYFHPHPPAGSYLETHWNVAGCYNRFIERSGCGGTVTSTPLPTATPRPTNTSVPTNTPTPTIPPTSTPITPPTATPITPPTATPIVPPTATPVNPPTQVAWYRFDETSGTAAADSSGSGRNATVTGGTWVPGLVGNAVNLSGSSQYVTLPAGIVSSLSDFTVATWVRLDTTGNWRRIFDFGSSTTVNMFLVPRSGSGAIRFAITTGGWSAEQQINGTSALPTGVWKHVAVTLSGNTGTLYVDGVQVGQNTNMTLRPSNLGNTSRNWLGRSQYTADAYLDGQLDQFQIYPRALSASEVLALFQTP